jgi:hypothetical protein
VAIEPQVAVVGTMAVTATVAVVVGPLVSQRAVDGEDVVRSVFDEAGVVAAVGADGAGALVPPFFRSSRPAC